MDKVENLTGDWFESVSINLKFFEIGHLENIFRDVFQVGTSKTYIS